MKNYTHLINTIKSLGGDVYWQGAANEMQIELLEKKLEVKLPLSYKEFLKLFGGGGVDNSLISGIENNDVRIKTDATVLKDTLECRNDFELPNDLIVIFYQYQEICWCLDSSLMNEEGECPVVSYDLFLRKVTNKIADNFDSFFREYLELRAEV